MKWLDLFSGIGMYARGLEQAGHEVIGFCENDTWARKILKKHWPTKPISSSIELLNKALMELLQDSHVRISAQQAMPILTAPVLPEQAQDSSGAWLTPFAWFDPDSLCWRTWQLCFDPTGSEIWEEYSEPWPPAGMMRNGIALAREPLAHPTIAPEHTFLRTLGASDGAGSSRERFNGNPNTMIGRMSDTLRTSLTCPPCTHPNFAEAMLGLPKDYTALEMETRPASSVNLQGDLNENA